MQMVHVPPLKSLSASPAVFREVTRLSGVVLKACHCLALWALSLTPIPVICPGSLILITALKEGVGSMIILLEIRKMELRKVKCPRSLGK